jgi:uncharacterized DUF497 family protein
MIFITYPLIWTQTVVDKILQKHNVNAEEIEESIFDDSPACIKGISGSYWLYGQTVAGRFLFIVLRKKPGKGRYKVITAREMIERERKYYQQSKK